MTIFYPQGAVILEILWEDFSKDKPTLNQSQPLIVQPKELTVEINNYKEADTAKFTIDYKNFPFEPRTIRNVKVTVSMTNQGELFDTKGRPSLLAPTDVTTLSPAAQKTFKNQLKEATVFIGYVDESEVDFNDDTREVKMECRDLTSLMIDRKAPRTLLDLTGDVFGIVRQILDSSDETSPIQIEVRPESLKDSTPTIAKISSTIDDKKKSPKNQETLWDVITDVCGRVALVPFMELDTLVITKPRLLFTNTTRRALVWGSNLRSLRFKRKLGRDKGINVEIRSLDPLSKTVRAVRYPEKSTGENGIFSEGVEKPQSIKKVVEGEIKEETAPYHIFFVPDITDSSVLMDRAEDIWNEMARQELDGSLSTKEMLICDKTASAEFNTLDIKMGTPIEIQIEPNDLAVLGTLKGKGIAAMRRYLVDQCYRPDVAQSLAESFDLMRKFATPFYTKKVSLKLSQSAGFSADIDFINFIELDPTVTGTTLPKGDS